MAQACTQVGNQSLQGHDSFARTVRTIPTVTQAQDSIQQVKQLKVDSHQHCLCIRPPRVRDAS